MIALPPVAARTEADLEFDRQIAALVACGVPDLIDFREDTFRAALEPLRDLLPTLPPGSSGIPFVVVVPAAPPTDVLASVRTADGSGFTTIPTDEVSGLRPRPELDVPCTPYLLLDVDTGLDTIGVAPLEAQDRIAGAGRTPLTVAEGLALLVSAPGILRSRNCFCLLGARTRDKRVPALWISSRRPRLGWSYQRAAHSWLGSASCGGRLGSPTPGN
jgi:hypothetical protein